MMKKATTQIPFSLLTLVMALTLVVASCNSGFKKSEDLPLLEVSENGHFLQDESGKPFFWLGDTGWLLFKKLTRDEAEVYLENRAQKGFNVIQAMVIHDLKRSTNYLGDSAFYMQDITRPVNTPGKDFTDETAYDYWDHIEYVIELAEEKGIYMALVPIWGSNVKGSPLSAPEAEAFGSWLAERYREHNNIIWMNGGDTPGDDSRDFWVALGSTLKSKDPRHLVTFHPRGRMQSSWWFHNENWLDFNMVQSGHRRYDQDDTELNYGEDNWRYIQTDYEMIPPKPTIDAEPSYEHIPQGLHDPSEPLWTARDVRRYAYWSVFSGAFGFTYGHNEIMQFYRPGDDPAYGAHIAWQEAMDAPGASQMIFLKDLLTSRPLDFRIPDQNLIAGSQGEGYEYQAACRGLNYAYIYTYTGRNIQAKMGLIVGDKIKASWFNPSTGKLSEIGEFDNNGSREFDPPGEAEDGNDWVLVMDSME